MKERLRASDYRFIAVCLVLSAGAAWYLGAQFLPRLSRSLHRFPREPRRRAGARRALSRRRSGYGVRGLPAGLALQLRRRGQDVPRARSRPGARQPHHGRRACACGAGATAGSGRGRRRSTASISRRRASWPASSTSCPKTPRVRPPSTPKRRARWPRISCAHALHRDPASLDFVEESDSDAARIAWIASSPGRSAIFNPARRHQPHGGDAFSATRWAATASTSRSPNSGRATTSACAPGTRWRRSSTRRCWWR